MAADQPSNADALLREQAAVEAVLKTLQGVDSLSSQGHDSTTERDGSVGDAQDTQVTDLVFGTAYDLANVDGGMVLLQTTGDANQSPINLAKVAESHPDMFSPHVGVEASVGFYQAIDQGFEELSAAEMQPAANPAARSTKEVKPTNRYSTNGEASARKASGVLAASTLAGALLWCHRRKQADEEKNLAIRHPPRDAVDSFRKAVALRKRPFPR